MSYGDEEHGIPGHAGKGSALALQRLLKNLGCRFEAEGDMVRIHLGDSLLEVKDEPGEGLILEASITLIEEAPIKEGSLLEVLGGVYKALKLFYQAAAGAKISYELDTSIPGYPILRARIRVERYDELTLRLSEALSKEGC